VKGKESESRRRGQRTLQRENGNAVLQLVWGSSLVVNVSLEWKGKRVAALKGTVGQWKVTGSWKLRESETGFYSRTPQQRVDESSIVAKSLSNQAKKALFWVVVSGKASRRKISFVAKSRRRTLFVGVVQSFWYHRERLEELSWWSALTIECYKFGSNLRSEFSNSHISTTLRVSQKAQLPCVPGVSIYHVPEPQPCSRSVAGCIEHLIFRLFLQRCLFFPLLPICTGGAWKCLGSRPRDRKAKISDEGRVWNLSLASCLPPTPSLHSSCQIVLYYPLLNPPYLQPPLQATPRSKDSTPTQLPSFDLNSSLRLSRSYQNVQIVITEYQVSRSSLQYPLLNSHNSNWHATFPTLSQPPSYNPLLPLDVSLTPYDYSSIG